VNAIECRKDADRHEICDAIVTVASNGAYLWPRLQVTLVNELRRTEEASPGQTCAMRAFEKLGVWKTGMSTAIWPLAGQPSDRRTRRANFMTRARCGFGSAYSGWGSSFRPSEHVYDKTKVVRATARCSDDAAAHRVWYVPTAFLAQNATGLERSVAIAIWRRGYM